MRGTETTIGDPIDKQEMSLIGSMSPDGIPDTKAMLLPRKREDIKIFYFTTNISSMRVSQYKANPKACVYFCDRRLFHGVMLTGTMEVLEDRKTKEMIWREGDTMCYSKGVTDPNYYMLCFTTNNSRYYSSFNSGSFKIEQTVL